MHTETTPIHVPVLLSAVLDHMRPQRGESYLDATAGYGGHAQAILHRTQAPEHMVLIDRDSDAVTVLRQAMPKAVRLMQSDYQSACKQLLQQGAEFDMILADIGVSSLHLDHADRGFSFREDGPLDMRMDRRTGLTAADIINTYDEKTLAGILRQYGEETHAKRIAEALVAARPILRTEELAAVIAGVVYKKGRLHPATKSFQALRIAVNDELGQLEHSLELWLSLLAPGGRLGVISFHSLEDRLVKQAFARVSGERYDAEFQLLTKHPVVADDAEIVSNPRARSAKLRVVAKINKKERNHPYANSRKK